MATEVDKLIRATMRSVTIQIEEHFAKHREEIENLKPLIERHALMIRARASATSGTQLAAFQKELEITEQTMRNHLLAIAVRLNGRK
jgi:hypothetical protein